MGVSPKWVKSKRRRKKIGERERLNDGDNNGQAMHGARKPPGPKIANMQSRWGTFTYVSVQEGGTDIWKGTNTPV